MKKRYILSVISGLILGLSWVEISGFFPLIFVALVPLLWIEEEVLKKRYRSNKVYFHGFLTFFIFNLISTWWIYHSSPEGAVMAILLSGMLVSFPFLFFHLTRKYIGNKEGYIGFVIYFLAFEWIDYRWSVSYPWLPFGNAFANTPDTVQWYEYTGVEGGSLWVLLVNLAVFFVLKSIVKQGFDIKIQAKKITTLVLLLLVPITISYWLKSKVDLGENNEKATVVLSQPNVDPYTKFGDVPSAYEYTSYGIFHWYEFVWIFLILVFIFILVETSIRKKIKYKQLIGKISILTLFIVIPVTFFNFMGNEIKIKNRDGMTALEQTKNILEVAESNMNKEVDLILAPETALPNSIRESSLSYSDEMEIIGNFLREYPNAKLLTGSSTHEFFNKKQSDASRKMTNGTGYWEAYNTALLVDKELNIQKYHKSKLVPGVEKLPLKFIMKYVESWFDLGGTSGNLGVEKEAKIFETGKIKIAPTICFESIYGEYTSEFSRKGANIIGIITNDAWWHNHKKCEEEKSTTNNGYWHDTPGYRQLLAYARLRAIENRKWIARSANTGITCFISPTGEIVKQAAWGESTSIKMDVPLIEGTTFYVRNGDLISRLALFISSLLLLLTFVRKWKR